LTTNILQSKQEITEEIKVKNDFELLTEKANKNREEIAQELQEQKRLRDLLKKSIDKVSSKEKDNDYIRNNLIQLSQ
jgi:hypothetical protein